MSSSSKAGSSSQVSPEIAAEIARLMRDPDALRSERVGMPRPGGRGHYDPNQPRVPAGDPRGGQFAPKGHRGGTQLAQLGPGAAHAQPLPFEGELGFMSPAQNRDGRAAFLQEDNNPQRNRRYDFQSDDGRYRFLSTGPYAHEKIPGGDRWAISSTTYAYDRIAGAYVIISATPMRPIVITISNNRISIERVELPFR